MVRRDYSVIFRAKRRFRVCLKNRFFENQHSGGNLVLYKSLLRERQQPTDSLQKCQLNRVNGMRRMDVIAVSRIDLLRLQTKHDY
jgi:hypothetical protein